MEKVGANRPPLKTSVHCRITNHIASPAYMRFKGNDYNYNDDVTWATYEYIAASNTGGLIRNFNTKLSAARSEATNTVEYGRRPFRIGQWAVLEISFGLVQDFLFTSLEIWSTAAHFLSGGTVESLVPVANLRHGDLIHLKQPGHNAYLAMCGVDRSCHSMHGVMGYINQRPSRSKWQVEVYGGYYYFKNPDHGTYLGMCGGADGCDGGRHNVYGFQARWRRTKFVVERIGNNLYLKNVDHNTYLGMCGYPRTSCGSSFHGVYGYSSRLSRTRWQAEYAYRDQADEVVTTDYIVWFKQPDHNAYLGMCGVSSGCGSARHDVYGYRTKQGRTRWRLSFSAGNTYVTNVDHGTYLGMCGVANGCDRGRHNVYGYSGRPTRTRWVLERSGSYVYLKNPSHGTYLGMCGVASGCNSNLYHVYGYSSKISRTRWIMTQSG